MADWFWSAIGAAILYGMHQVLPEWLRTGLATGWAALSWRAPCPDNSALPAVALRDRQLETVVQRARRFLFCPYGSLRRRRDRVFLSAFQKGGPLSAVPMILAGGASLMAVVGIFSFKESASWQRLLSIALSIIGLFLLRL